MMFKSIVPSVRPRHVIATACVVASVALFGVCGIASADDGAGRNLAIMSDVHVPYAAVDGAEGHVVVNEETGKQSYYNSNDGTQGAVFGKVLDAVSDAGYEHVLVVGDLGKNGAQSDYDAYKAVLDKHAAELEVVEAIGNHELASTDVAKRAELRARWTESMGSPIYFEQMVDGVHVWALGSDADEETHWANGNISDVQLDWLEAGLDKDYACGITSVVLCHWPVLGTYPAHDKDLASGVEPVSYFANQHMDERLYEIVEAHPNAVVFTGHTHHWVQRNGVATVFQTDGGGMFVHDGAIMRDNPTWVTMDEVLADGEDGAVDEDVDTFVLKYRTLKELSIKDGERTFSWEKPAGWQEAAASAAADSTEDRNPAGSPAVADDGQEPVAADASSGDAVARSEGENGTDETQSVAVLPVEGEVDGDAQGAVEAADASEGGQGEFGDGAGEGTVTPSDGDSATVASSDAGDGESSAQSGSEGVQGANGDGSSDSENGDGNLVAPIDPGDTATIIDSVKDKDAAASVQSDGDGSPATVWPEGEQMQSSDARQQQQQGSQSAQQQQTQTQAADAIQQTETTSVPESTTTVWTWDAQRQLWVSNDGRTSASNPSAASSSSSASSQQVTWSWDAQRQLWVASDGRTSATDPSKASGSSSAAANDSVVWTWDAQRQLWVSSDGRTSATDPSAEAKDAHDLAQTGDNVSVAMVVVITAIMLAALSVGVVAYLRKRKDFPEDW